MPAFDTSGTPSVPLPACVAAAELQATRRLRLYEAIQRARPLLLRMRNAWEPIVYVDGIRTGGLDTLRQMRAYDVLEVRRLSDIEATTRYGTGHRGGAVIVVTRHGDARRGCAG